MGKRSLSPSPSVNLIAGLLEDLEIFLYEVNQVFKRIFSKSSDATKVHQSSFTIYSRLNSSLTVLFHNISLFTKPPMFVCAK